MIPPRPHNEKERLDALRQLDILDTDPEQGFDDLTALAADICDVPVALVCLVDDQRQWFKSKVGLDVCETDRNISFCGHAILQDQLMEVPDAAADPRFCDNPLVVGEPRIRFYAGMPLMNPAGYALGTLCIIDTQPRQLDCRQRGAMQRLARQVVDQMELRRTVGAQRRQNDKLAKLSLVAARTDNAVIITDAAGMIEWVNDGFTRITEYALDEVVGRKPGDILQGPDTDRSTVEHIRQRLQAERVCEAEILNYSKSGRPYWINAQIQPVCDESGRLQNFIAIERDVTDEKQNEAALRDSETRQRLILDTALDAVVCMDAEGLITRWNQQAEQMFGWAATEAIGRRLEETIIPEKFREMHNRGVAHFLETGEGPVMNQRIEVPALRRSGEEFPCELAIAPMRAGGEVSFSAFVRDISERKRNEEQLQQAKEAADAANAAKSSFLAHMSHEMRTPLNAVIGFSELMLRDAADDLPDPQRDWMQSIRGSGKHLLSLINDVLDLSKIEAGRMEYESMQCSPHALLTEVLSTLRVTAQEKDLSLEIEYASHLPRTLTTDPTRLRQIIANLLSNAIKFTDAGSVKLVASLEVADHAGNKRKVTGNAPLGENGEARFRIDVIDSGVGIRADKLEHIFSAFSQADSSVTRKFGGTGLGLAISKQMCLDLGGDLCVSSQPGVGSTFTCRIDPGALEDVDLIDRRTAEAVRDDHAAGHDSTDEANLSGRILVVDDGATNRKLISVMLKRSGATVQTAENGQIAVDMATREAFDAILMDMQMPVMDGYTAAGELRRRGIATPIIALTAHAMKGDRERCVDAGCTDYLVKPINHDALIRTVHEVLGEAAQAAAATSAPAREPRHAPDAQAGEATRKHSVEDASEAVSKEAASTGPALVSSLPMDDEDFREIAEMFVEKLETQVQAMRQALDDTAMTELAELAHWLKGSGGTAGYDAFTQPAAALEQLARGQAADVSAASDATDDLTRQLDEVADLLARARRGLPTAASAAHAIS